MFKVIVKDTLRASSYMEYHGLSLIQATRLAIKLSKGNIEAFVVEEDAVYQMLCA